MFWNVVEEDGLTFAEHYIGGCVLYDLCLDHLAANPASAEGDYLNVESKTWGGKFAANELRSIVEDFKQGGCHAAGYGKDDLLVLVGGEG